MNLRFNTIESIRTWVAVILLTPSSRKRNKKELIDSNCNKRVKFSNDNNYKGNVGTQIQIESLHDKMINICFKGKGSNSKN